MTSTEVEGMVNVGRTNGTPGRRLNMDHGFIKYIWRNQIDRDEYHKIHEKRKTDIKETLKKDERRKSSAEPATNLYIPPALRKLKSLDTTKPVSNVDVETELSISEKNDPEPKQPRQASFDEDSSKSRPVSFVVGNEHEEELIRRGVRRRYHKESRAVDELCISLANSSLQDDGTKPKSDEFLFSMRLILKNGEEVLIDVPRTTQAARLAKSVTREYNFDDEQCRNLRIFIEKQFEARIGLPSIVTPPPSDLDQSSNSL